LLRLNDYFLTQLIESLADTNPFELMIELLKREIDPFTLSEGADSEEVKHQKLLRIMSQMLDESSDNK